MPEAKPKRRTPRQLMFYILNDWIRPIAVVVIIAFSFRSAIADWNDVPTGSMKPTILEGDRIVVNKLAYDLKLPFTRYHLLEWEAPDRGDIVVFYAPDSGTRMVKRIVGLPGDTIGLFENQLFINGQRVDYLPLADGENADVQSMQQQGHRFATEILGEHEHAVMLTPGVGSRRTFRPIEVPEGHYFAMGDNRDNSRDSRWFGFVPRDVIVGKAVGVAMSLDPDYWRLPRWNRFFHELQ
ncbi:MAG: signal peptidase I [Phycisphaerae bacterium]